MTEPTHELFHAIADPASAALRLLVLSLGVKERVSFRNVAYEEALADLERRGGGEVPALWDGERLHVGPEAVRAELYGLAAGR